MRQLSTINKSILIIGDEPLGLDDEEYSDSESEPEQLYGAPALGEYAPPEEARSNARNSDDYDSDDYEDLLFAPDPVVI